VANQTTNGCGPGGGGATALLPVSPFYAPRYHFGMLLGVDDFEAEQGYHRGKLRLHNAWLHGAGVVWGLGVDVDRRGQVGVDPGLALDAAGRELYLDARACVSLAAWYDAHREDNDVQAAARPGRDGVSVRLDLHVVARFRACAARPVPSIAEPCDAGGATDGIAFSRAQETVELLLRPGLAPPRELHYHRLRVLFSLEPAGTDDGEVETERQRILALPSADQPAAYLDAFRRFAALDEMDLGPAKLANDAVSLFPAGDDCEVVLANLPALVVKPGGTDGGWTFVSVGAVDNGVRPSHVSTFTIEELLCGPLFAFASGASPAPTPAPTPAPRPVPDAGGPRIDPASVEYRDDRVTLKATRPLARGSVRPEAFSVSAFELQRGWHDVEINSVRLDRGGYTVHLLLASGVLGHTVRVIAKGTGPAPLLGADLVPLAGPITGPPGSTDDGHDFVRMIPRSAP
jgi:hypothetical protein